MVHLQDTEKNTVDLFNTRTVKETPTRSCIHDQWRPFPMTFQWQTGLWFELFQKHVDYIVSDIRKMRANDHAVMYLSCPIASHSGSHSPTNIDIARNAAKNIVKQWGDTLWILNPAHYQMESPEETGLIKRHAQLLSLETKIEEAIDIDSFAEQTPITGGDHLRM